jgi:hypothetical protein
MQLLAISEIHTHPEVELLICCARMHPETKTAERIRALLREHIDWDYLLQIASHHGVMPLLYWNLKTIDRESLPDRSSVPKDILDQLQHSFRKNAAYNLFLTAELLKVQSLFETQDIPILTFKGPALAVSAYGDAALRQFVDLDILVRKKDVLEASKLLIGQGLRPQFRLTDKQETTFIEFGCEHAFVREDESVMIDLHWAIVPLHYSFALDTESLWTRRTVVALNGRNVPTVAPEDLFLLLCIHGAKANHCWRHLSWICDLAQLIRVHRDMDWRRMIDQAGKVGSERMLFLGMYLASDLLGANLPHEIMQEVRVDPAVEELAAQVYRWLFSEAKDQPSLFRMRRFHLRTMTHLRDRARYLLELMTPTPLEWELLPLPRYFYGFYYVLRPIRLAGKFGGELLKRIGLSRGSIER